MGDGRPLTRLADALSGRRGAVLLAAALALLFLAPLVDPATRIAPRDFAQFNLPLHAGFARLARFGLPEWNPELWGGQPLLSNPNYAPFYPPTWLVLVLEPSYALQLSVALHALLAAVGAAQLVARLGGRASACWLAALAFGGGGWFLGLVHALRILFGVAWIPWVLLGARRIATASDGAARRRAALTFAGSVAALSLAGEPLSVLLGVAAAACALLFGDRPHAATVRRGVAAGGLGLALGAVQLLPGFARLSDTVRAAGIAYDKATLWSMRPARLVELLLPRFFGDVSRLEEGYFFGWTLHDRGFPYLLLITPGLLLALLGLVALLARAIPWRWVWTAGALLGALLALGRHNPLYPWLWSHLPGLATVRYPEKFLLATTLSLLFAGALAWSRLLDQRDAGRCGEADLPAALAAAAAAVALLLGALLHLEPRLGTWFVTAMSPIEPGSPLAAAAAGYLERQAWLAAALAVAVTALLLAARWPRVRNRALAAGALGLLTIDLWGYGHRLLFRVPAATYLEAPPLARSALEHPGRLWSSAELSQETEVWVTGQRRSYEIMRARARRLDPSAGAIWGIRYALTSDFDLTLTRSARRATELFESCWKRLDQDLAYRFLGAWSVDKLAIVLGSRELRRELARGNPDPELADLVINPYYLPLGRFVPRADWYTEPAAAERAALAARLPVPTREFLIAPGVRPASRFDPFATITHLADRGDEIEIHYRARSEALLVVASTFDVGWSAVAAAERLPVFETATGMLAVVVPAGERTLRLRYRDPWVRVGAAVSASALLAGALAWARSRRRDPAPAAP